MIDASELQARIDRLAYAGEAAWVDDAQKLLNGDEPRAALALLHAATAAFPRAHEIAYWRAVALRACGDPVGAELQLRALDAAAPGNPHVAILLAQVLHDQGRDRAAVEEIASARPQRDRQLVLATTKLLDECDASEAALVVCEQALADGAHARLELEAGVLAMKLGRFDAGRAHVLAAAESTDPQVTAYALHALANAQRYAEPSHPDFARFAAALAAPASDADRSTVLFALGKARDDVGDIDGAAAAFDEANALARRTTSWSEDGWNAILERLVADTGGTVEALPATPHFNPVFIVGAPRSGTTLLAETVAQHFDARVRGEAPLIDKLWSDLDRTHALHDTGALGRARDFYVARVRRDDAPAALHLDKQPFNFLHVPFILRLFPNARFLYSHRDARDTALSLWMQHFADPAAGFAYRWDGIATVLHGVDRMMQRWQTRHADAILRVDYETFVREPGSTIAAMATHLGVAVTPVAEGAVAAGSRAIATSSMWQARQPLYERSIGRSDAYLARLPELARIGDATRSADPGTDG